MRKCLTLLLAVGLAACITGPPDDLESSGQDDGATAGTGSVGSSMGGDGGHGGGSGVGSGPTSSGQTTGSGMTTTGGGPDDPCPQDMVCVSSFPFVHAGTTSGAPSDVFDQYGCGPQDESGPEVVYRIDVPSEGFLFADLPEASMGAGVDVDVHLLGSLDGDDCLDRGHWQLGELLPAGRYYLTVDTWVAGNGDEAHGAYGLELGLITVDDLQGWGMKPAVASDALFVFDRAWTAGQVDTTAYAVVDFAMHASEKRMWIFDVFDATLSHHTYTTVGDASDPNGDGWADVFSNTSGSHQSSLGLMKGAELYTGTYGLSMRMDGLEPGYNDAIRGRAIVMHPWNGSAPAYVNANPAVGAAPTWGCLGVDPAIADDMRQVLGNGGLVLSHFPDGDWSSQSAYLP